MFSPSSRQGGGRYHRGPSVLCFLYRIVQYHFASHRIVTYPIVSCRFFRRSLSNCITSPFTAMWSVPTVMARIHCVDVPVMIRQRECCTLVQVIFSATAPFEPDLCVIQESVVVRCSDDVDILVALRKQLYVSPGFICTSRVQRSTLSTNKFGITRFCKR